MHPRTFLALALLGPVSACSSHPVFRMLGSVDAFYDTATSRSREPKVDRLDAWGRSFRFEARAAGFVLVSAGYDGVWNTSDDLDFSPQSMAERASHLVGCWKFDSIATPGGAVASIHLKGKRQGGRATFVGASNNTSLDVEWLPWGRDSVVIILQDVQKILLHGERSATEIRGAQISFGEAPWRSRSRDAFRALRIPC